MNLINAVPAGKTLKKSQQNLLAKLSEFGVVAGNERQTRVNRISGVSRELDPLAVALFDFIMESYAHYLRNYSFQYRGHKFPVGTWDRTRYLFLELWPDEYYDLID